MKGNQPVRSVWLNERNIAEHLLNNKLQMRCFCATEALVTLTKQTKIDQHEQARVNWQVAA
jgi:hypothetical protein